MCIVEMFLEVCRSGNWRRGPPILLGMCALQADKSHLSHEYKHNDTFFNSKEINFEIYNVDPSSHSLHEVLTMLSLPSDGETRIKRLWMSLTSPYLTSTGV